MDMMVAALNRMVEEWAEMHERKLKMEEEMLQYLMQQMQMGKKSMTPLPMMQGMKGVDGISGSDHNGHK